MKKGLLFLGVALWATVSAAAPVKWKYLRIPEAQLTESFVKKYDFVRDHKHDDEFAFGYIPTTKFKQAAANAGEQIVELDARAWSETDYDAKTLMPVYETTRAPFGPYEEYHTYTSLTAEMKTLAEKFPHLATLHSAGKTVEGRELWYLRISAKTVADVGRPKVLYVSSMHGDEVVGKEMLVYFLRELLGRYGTDDRITALVNYGDLYIMPSMNPDGTERHQRWNADGVDLNRNFPELDEQPFSTAGRAIETKNLMELHRTEHFLLAINFHTGALCVNLPWDSKPNTGSSLFGDDKLMMSLAREYTKHNTPMLSVSSGSFDKGVTYGWEWYEVLGGMQDWASFFRGSTHATVELSNVKWPSASTLPGLWQNNREALLTYFERGLDGIHLKIVNEEGALVSGVSVDISTAKRTLTYDGGYIHRPTIAGQQQVTLKAAGYSTQTLSVDPYRFDGTYQTVVMRK